MYNLYLVLFHFSFVEIYEKDLFSLKANYCYDYSYNYNFNNEKYVNIAIKVQASFMMYRLTILSKD